MMAELAARVIASGQFESIAAAHRRHTGERSRFVRAYLPDKICRDGDADIFRWVRLPERFTSVQSEQAALARGVRDAAASWAGRKRQ